jgi:hypothetical protein
VAQDWRLTRRSPGFTYNRYEQEPAFVQERQVGPKFLGFFLYGARYFSSNRLWPFRLFEERVSLASDNSTQNCGATVSIPPRAYSGLRSRPESVVRYALTSIGRWYAQLLRLLSAAFSSAVLSDVRPIGRAAPIWPGSECLVGPSSDRFDTNALQNLGTLSTLEPQCGRVCLKAA